MRWENTLMAYEKDIKSKSFGDWIKAHTSFMKPLHKYEGMLELNGGKTIFKGRDPEEDRDFNLEIPIKDIADIYLGFDSVFRKREDRQTAIRGFVPLRITYKSREGEKSLYLFANFHHSKYGWRTSDNKEVYEKLESSLGSRLTHQTK